MKELYFSCDVEADGPLPGKHSMLSIGAVAIDERGEALDEYYATLKEMPGTSPYPDTEHFWKAYPYAYDKARENPRDPELVMSEFSRWIKSFGAEKNVFVAHPAVFDYAFINHYFITFLGRNPFSFNVIDIRSMVAGLLGSGFTDSGMDSTPIEWRSRLPHTHVAIDDAKQQGELFSAVLKASRESDDIRKISMHKMEEIVETGRSRIENAAALALKIRSFYGTKPSKKIVYR
jgi:DNA polymerase III alpha subunit (gram-positive type)